MVVQKTGGEDNNEGIWPSPPGRKTSLSTTKPNARADDSPYLVRMWVEAAAGILTALTVAPAVSIVDKAIVSNASGRQALVPSLSEGIKTLVTRPTLVEGDETEARHFGIRLQSPEFAGESAGTESARLVSVVSVWVSSDGKEAQFRKYVKSY